METTKIKELFVAKLGNRTLKDSTINDIVAIIQSNFPGDDVTEEQINTAIDCALPIIDLNLPNGEVKTVEEQDPLPMPKTKAEQENGTLAEPQDRTSSDADISSHIGEEPAKPQPEDPLKTFAETGKFTPDDEGQIEASEPNEKAAEPGNQPDPLAEMLDLKTTEEEKRTAKDEGVINADEHTQGEPSATEATKEEVDGKDPKEASIVLESIEKNEGKDKALEVAQQADPGVTNTSTPSTETTEETTGADTQGVSQPAEATEKANAAVEEAVQQVEEAQQEANTSTDSDVQAQIDALKAQNEKLATELAQKIESDKHNERTARYKEVIAPIKEIESQYNLLLSGFENMTFASDGDFDSFIQQTESQVKNILQDWANKGLQMTAPGFGTGGTESNLLAQQINAKTKEILNSK